MNGSAEPTSQDALDGGRVIGVEKNPMAFGHAEIIATAFLRMLAFDPRKLAFFFLPEKFTLANYIDVYRYLTHEEADLGNLPNLRRQLTETKDPLLVVCPGEFEDLCGRGHARAKRCGLANKSALLAHETKLAAVNAANETIRKRRDHDEVRV